MNIYNLPLISASSDSNQLLPELEFEDYTKLVLDFSGVSIDALPIYIKIDWGYGDVVVYDNDIYRTIKNTISSPTFDQVFRTETIYNEYFPSTIALYKTLSAQVLISYSNSNYSLFTVPIKIRSYDFMESVEDLELINTNILPIESNVAEHQFKTLKDGYIIELRGS